MSHRSESSRSLRARRLKTPSSSRIETVRPARQAIIPTPAARRVLASLADRVGGTSFVGDKHKQAAWRPMRPVPVLRLKFVFCFLSFFKDSDYRRNIPKIAAFLRRSISINRPKNPSPRETVWPLP